jgi:hypothetical protein
MSRKIVGIIILVAFIVIILYTVYQLAFITVQGYIMQKATAMPTYSLTSVDSAIFPERTLANLNVEIIHNSNMRLPISNLNFDTTYLIIRHEIPISAANNILNNLIHVEYKDTTFVQEDGIYKTTWTKYLECKYRTEPPKPVSQIYFTLYGDSTFTVVQNDSLLSYHLVFQNLSVRFSRASQIDTYIHLNNNKEKVPMEVLFLRRDSTIHFLIMTPNNPNTYLPKGLLYEKVMK